MYPFSPRKGGYKMSILRIHLQYLNGQKVGKPYSFIKKLHEKKYKKSFKIRILNNAKHVQKRRPQNIRVVMVTGSKKCFCLI